MGGGLPRRLGRYELRQRIGHSGSSEVYRAGIAPGVDGLDERALLVREMFAFAYVSAPKILALWVEAMRPLMHVSGPHVVPLLDAATEGGMAYAVMPFIEGMSLQLLMRRVHDRGERLPWQVAARIVLDVLDGLQSVHEARDDESQPLGLVYGQLNARSVLVSASGDSWLLDRCDQRASETLRAIGHAPLMRLDVRAMAPERATRGDTSQGGDVWAAGMLAWELLAGRRFLADQPDVDFVKWLMDGAEAMPALRSMCPEAPDTIEDIVARALRRDPAARWPSVRQMRDALADAWSAEGRLADPLDVQQFVQAASGPQAESRDDHAPLFAGSYRDNALTDLEAPRVARDGAPLEATRASVWRRLWARLRG